MIDAKTAHRLSEEQWNRRKGEELSAVLDKIEARVQRAIKNGEWSAHTGLNAGHCSTRISDALVALGYTVNIDRRRQTNPVSISWGAPKDPRS